MNTETKEQRIFNIYKKDLKRLADKDGRVRFICIEYLCKFPDIDPFEMAAALIREGNKVIYDDSSISKAENEKKRKAVEKLMINQEKTVMCEIYGVILNDKGLAEKNYLYTKEQLEEFVGPMLELNPDGYEDAITACRTYIVLPLNTEKDVREFLAGCYNSCDSYNDEIIENWYYTLDYNCLWTGRENPTVKYWMNRLGLAADDVNGVDERIEDVGADTLRHRLRMAMTA